MQWFAWEVLQIDDIATCASYAHSQGRRCRNPLSYARKEAAEVLLNQLSRYAISCEGLIHESLEVLASYLLCPQRHEDQAESLIETWKRRILRFQRMRAMQEIQDLESTVGDITASLEASSLTAPQLSTSCRPPTNFVFTTNASPQSQECDTAQSASISSSSRQRFTTTYTHEIRSSDVQFVNRNDNLLRSRDRVEKLYKETSSSQLTPVPATSQQAQGSNDQSQTLQEAKSDCPICFEGYQDRDDVSRCHGCLEKFHESCIKAWLEQCKERSVNVTCPCW